MTTFDHRSWMFFAWWLVLELHAHCTGFPQSIHMPKHQQFQRVVGQTLTHVIRFLLQVISVCDETPTAYSTHRIGEFCNSGFSIRPRREAWSIWSSFSRTRCVDARQMVGSELLRRLRPIWATPPGGTPWHRSWQTRSSFFFLKWSQHVELRRYVFVFMWKDCEKTNNTQTSSSDDVHSPSEENQFLPSGNLT